MSFQLGPPLKLSPPELAKRKSNYFLYLNLWPVVTVMIALLFLFMPLTVLDGRGIAVDRPHARNATAHPHALREDSIH